MNNKKDGNPLQELTGYAEAKIGLLWDWSEEAFDILVRRTVMFLVLSFLIIPLAVVANLFYPPLVPFTAFLYLLIAVMLVVNEESLKIAGLTILVDAVYDFLTRGKGFIPNVKIDAEGHIHASPDFDFERTRRLHTLTVLGKAVFTAVLFELCFIAFLSYADLTGKGHLVPILILLTLIMFLLSTKWGRTSRFAWISVFVVTAWVVIAVMFIINPLTAATEKVLAYANSINPFLLLILAMGVYSIIAAIPEPKPEKAEKGDKK